MTQIAVSKSFTVPRKKAAESIECSIDLMYHWEQNSCPYLDPDGEGLISQNSFYDEKDVQKIRIAFKAAKAFVKAPPGILSKLAFKARSWEWTAETFESPATAGDADYYSTTEAREYTKNVVKNTGQCIDPKYVRCIEVFGRTYRYFNKKGLDLFKASRPTLERPSKHEMFLDEVMECAGCELAVIDAIRAKYKKRLTIETRAVLTTDKKRHKKVQHRITMNRRELFGPEDEAACEEMRAQYGEIRLPIFVETPNKGAPIKLIGHEELWYFLDDACERFGCSRAFLNRYMKTDTIQKRGGKAIRGHLFFIMGDHGPGAHKGRRAVRGDDIEAIKDGKEELNPKVFGITLYTRKQKAKLRERAESFLAKLRPLLPIRASDGIRLAEIHGFRANHANPPPAYNPRPVDADEPPEYWTTKPFREVFRAMGFRTKYQYGEGKSRPRWWCDKGQKAPTSFSADEIVRRYQAEKVYAELAAGPITEPVPAAPAAAPPAGQPDRGAGADAATGNGAGAGAADRKIYPLLGIEVDSAKWLIVGNGKTIELGTKLRWHIFNVALTAHPAPFLLETMKKDYPGDDGVNARKSVVTDLNKLLSRVGLRIENRTLILLRRNS